MEFRLPPDFYSSAVSFGTNRSQRIAIFCVLSAQKDCRFFTLGTNYKGNCLCYN